MGLIRFFKIGLFIYECIRILLLALILIIKGTDSGLLIRMVFAAPSALFPLMALFILLDTNRYKAYLPLFLAGKSIGVFLEALWSIISIRVTMNESMDHSVILAQLILSGDLFSLAAAIMIVKYVQKPDMEEK
jgi:hypothetical protein